MFKNAFVLTLVLSACVDQVESVDIEATNKLAGNALAPGYLQAANLSHGRLTAANLQGMASTYEGRLVLPYVVGCALPAGTNVTTTYNPPIGSPISITFNGEIGLATNWQAAHLTTSQQQIVSACVLARVNQAGISVQVSLRGPSSALAVKASELASHTKFEGVFFGNVFSSSGSFRTAACRGTGESLPEGRLCAEEDTGGLTHCGYEYAGSCATACTTVTTASNHTYYQDCAISGANYVEAVTTNVQ